MSSMRMRQDEVVYERVFAANDSQAGDINNIENLLKPHIGSATEIYTDIFSQPKTSVFSRLFSTQSVKAEGLHKLFESSKVKALRPIINEIRVSKSDAEIANMRQAGRASGRAFTKAMRQAWLSEKDLATFLEYKFRRNGCDASAYVPVVAGGQVCLRHHRSFSLANALRTRA